MGKLDRLDVNQWDNADSNNNSTLHLKTEVNENGGNST